MIQVLFWTTFFTNSFTAKTLIQVILSDSRYECLWYRVDFPNGDLISLYWSSLALKGCCIYGGSPLRHNKLLKIQFLKLKLTILVIRVTLACRSPRLPKIWRYKQAVNGIKPGHILRLPTKTNVYVSIKNSPFVNDK